MNETQQELLKYGFIRETPEISISIFHDKVNNKQVVRIKGLPNGCTIHAQHEDWIDIEAYYAADRFKEPRIKQFYP